MAQAKPEVLFNAENHTWQIQVKDAQGNTRVSDKVVSMEPMETVAAVRVFLGLAKDAPNKRLGAMTLLSVILSEFHEMVAPWQGTADVHKGIPNELKGQFRDCEGKFFERYMDPKHPEHEQFIGRLPTADGRGNELTIAGKLNRQAQFQAFLTNTRAEPTYNNAKNVVLGYFAYYGKMPVGDDGRLIPPEIMTVLVRNARIVEQADNSFKGRLSTLYRVLCADSEEGEKPTDAELPAVTAMLQEMLVKAKELESSAAQRAQELRKPGDVVGITEASIAKAQASTGLRPYNPEPQPNKANAT